MIENNNCPYFEAEQNITINTNTLTKINKQFDLLKEDLKKNNEEGLMNIILCSSNEHKKKDSRLYLSIQKKIFSTNVYCFLA